MKYALLALLQIVLASQALAYQYSYVPKTETPVVYNILYKRSEKCTTGEKQPYPKQIGACVSCPKDSAYMIDDTKKKAFCLRCPQGTLLTKNDGYPMCLSDYPVKNGAAVKPNGTEVSDNELERMALALSATYKSVLPEIEKEETEKTFKNKELLKNVCPNSYPTDPKAKREIEICKRLVKQNDFLCPYVERNAENQWACRACPKNAPYKNKQGGCFTCPYGEEMVSTEDGKSVCASEAPKPKAKPKKVFRRKTKRRR